MSDFIAAAHPILKLRAIEKSFGENHVLRGIDAEIGRGEIVGLLGPNGCGKSTLLNVITGFAAADTGTILFTGTDITRLQTERIVAAGLVRTFQLPSMPRRMTVEEVLYAARRKSAGLSTILRSPPSEREAIESLLDELNLSHVRDLPAASLSGGQKKLLSIALALRASPSLLCLDEPTAGVHPELRLKIVSLLRKWREAGLTLLIVEHDMHFIRELCDRCIVLESGSVIAECIPRELTANPRVVEAYLGRAREKKAHA